MSQKHLPRYLDEFTNRFDRRWREGEFFGFVLQRAVCGASRCPTPVSWLRQPDRHVLPIPPRIGLPRETVTTLEKPPCRTCA